MDLEHLTAVCTGLGSTREVEDGREAYVKHPDCLVNLKHLQRFLRRDDPTHRDIFMQLGKWNTIRQDILPIIIHYRHSYDLVLNAVKVMVFLTMPVDLSSTNIPQQLEYLRQFKAAVLEDDAIGVIVSHLQDPLEHMECGTLTDMDGKMFQLVLTLIRNLLAVDDMSSPLIRASASSNPHASYIKDELLERLFKENVMDLLLALTQHVDGEQPFLRQDNLLILEIFNYLFASQVPDVIAASSERAQKQSKSNQATSAVLEALITNEQEGRRGRDFRGPRHSNFCGTFVRIEKDGTKTILTRNPYQSPLDNLFQKPEIKRGQVRKVANDLPLQSPSNATVCGLLKGLADQFLEGSYNLLMQTVKDDIRSERNNVQSQDMVMFFTVANFFTAYQRCLLMKNQPSEGAGQSGEGLNPTEGEGATFQGRCGRIASTMDEDMFTLVTMKWQSFVEGAKLTHDWFPPTTAGTLLKEMIHMLDSVLKAADRNSTEGQQEVRVARILLYKVFYDHTENGILPFLFRLIKSFDVHKQPRSQLAGLIETTHIVLRLLDSITKEDGALRVKKKARNVRKKGTKASKEETTHPATCTEKEKDQVNPSGDEEIVPQPGSNADPIAPEVGEAGSAPTAAGEADADHVSKATSSEVAEMPAAMDSEPAIHGEEGIAGKDSDSCGEDVEGAGEGEGKEGDYSERDSEEEEEEEEEVKTKEETLDVLKCVKMFADNTVLHNYCWLLKNYVHNAAATNYYIVRMLQRICQDCMMEPMLYQLSILQTCYEILANKSVKNSEQHQYVVAFLTKLVRHLFQKLQKSPMLFVDLLFWKTKQDCHCITADYMIHDLQKASAGSKGKSASRAVDFQDRRALLNSLGDDDDDDVDDITKDATAPRVESVPTTHNSNGGASGGGKGKVTRQKAVKRKGPFSDFEEDLIKELFEKHKENRSCTKLIAQGLSTAGAIQDSGDPFTPAQVGRALKRLGLERVVKKKVPSKFLENIGSDDESGRENGSDDGDGAAAKSDDSDHDHDHDEVMGEPQRLKTGPTIADKNGGSDGDEAVEGEAAEIRRIFSTGIGPKKKRKGLLESLEEDSSDIEDTKGGAPDGDEDGNKNGGSECKSPEPQRKRKSGDGSTKGKDGALKRRRKSGLFSEEQDHQLQSLFEKYKGMTRFRHLISHDLEGAFTPVQIGRRLQQLGCVQPKSRKSTVAEMSDEDEETPRRKSDGEDEHRPDGENDGPSASNLKEGEAAGMAPTGAFRASWGSSARKNAQKKNPAAVVEEHDARGPKTNEDAQATEHGNRASASSESDDDDLPVAQHVKKTSGREHKRAQPEGKPAAESGESGSDDDRPIGNAIPSKKIRESKERLPSEPEPEAAAGGRRGSGEGPDLSGDSDGDVGPMGPGSHGARSGNSVDREDDDDQPIGKSMVIGKTFERKRGLQADDQQAVAVKKTYERKKKGPQVERKAEARAAWGDSDTDASDIDESQARHDLATVLQEVKSIEKMAERRTKKRRLARKHVENDSETATPDDLAVASTLQRHADESQPENSAGVQSRKGARKAVLDAMESDDDE